MINKKLKKIIHAFNPVLLSATLALLVSPAYIGYKLSLHTFCRKSLVIEKVKLQVEGKVTSKAGLNGAPEEKGWEYIASDLFR